MIGVALALSSSLVWGCSDFFGGAVSRRVHVLAVSALSQVGGFVLLLAMLAVSRSLDGHSFRVGLIAGVAGAVGLSFFYAALAAGTMSIVAPIVGCSAIVPFTLAIVGGERPPVLALSGAGLALAGIVLASLDEHRAEGGARGRAVLLALIAALGNGLFLYFLGLGSRHGDVLSTLVGARVTSLPLLVVAALSARAATARIGLRPLLLILAVGVGDVTANGLFGFASHHGLLAIVSVLGSVYPITTVLLAHLLLGERISRVQKLGVAAATAGVALTV
ncbi:MAG: DMT family transporter [Gaiellaceae bacterium]